MRNQRENPVSVLREVLALLVEADDEWDVPMQTASTRPMEDSANSSSHQKALDHIPQALIEKLGLLDLKIENAGQFGVVASAVSGRMKGRKIAIKFFLENAYTHKPEQEVRSYNAVRSVRAKLPRNLAKHLPEIFGVVRVGSSPFIIMEFLQPADEDVVESLFGTIYHSDKLKHRVQTDPVKMSGYFRRASEMMHRKFKGDVDWQKNQPLRKLLFRCEKIWMDFNLKGIDGDSDIVQVKNALKDKFLDASSEMKLDDKTSMTPEFLKMFIDGLASAVVNLASGPQVSGNLRAKTSQQDDDPQVQTFSAIGELFRYLGVAPDDVHAGNVMKRPGSDVLVISDLGEFISD